MPPREDLKSTTLMLGDCLDRMAELPDGSVDAIIADPPYCSTQCRWDRRIDIGRFWPEAKRLLSPGGAVVLFADLRYAAELVTGNPSWFRHDLVWDKVAPVGFLNANRASLRSHELMLVFGPGPARYRPQKWRGEPYSAKRRIASSTPIYGDFGGYTSGSPDGLRFPTSIVRESNSNGEHSGKIHPTQKPVPLMRWLVRTYSDPGMKVLDPTMGSGSTILACLEEGRRSVGIERDPGYFAIAERRIAEALASKEPLRAAG